MKFLLAILIALPFATMLVIGTIQQIREPSQHGAQLLQPEQGIPPIPAELSTTEDLAKAKELSQNNKHSQAIILYKRLLNETSSTPEILRNLIPLLIRERKLEEAKTILQTSEGSADEETMRLLTAYLNLQEEKTTETQSLLESITTAHAIYLQALTAIIEENLEHAKTLLTVLSNSSEDTEWRTNALALREEFNRPGTEPQSENGYLLTLIAKRLSSMGEPYLSLILSQKAVKKNPSYRDAWILLGFNQLQMNQLPDAEKSLLEAYKIDPTRPQTQFLLGKTYALLKEYPQSSKFLQYALKNNYSPPSELYEQLAENAMSQDTIPIAEYYWNKLLESEPQNPEIFIRPIWFYLNHLNDSTSALSLAKKATSLFPNASISYNLVAWVLLEKGDTTEAISYLTTARQLDPMLPPFAETKDPNKLYQTLLQP